MGLPSFHKAMHTTLEPFESAVLEKLLEGRHPVLEALRDQLKVLSVRERKKSNAGFFVTFASGPTAKPALVAKDKIRFGDVHADVEGLASGAGFVLYIDGGLIRMLEGYSYEEAWPDRIARFTLSYTGKDRSAELSKLG